MDYKEYLDKARIKQLAELQARYNQVYAKERAEAASSLIAGHRQLRRGLQNVGLAGRKGNLISGREKTAALEARRRYREYNAGLSRAANTFTTAAGQRMARQAIDDENRVKRAEAYAKWGDEYAAAKAEAEKEYAAKLEEAKQEHLQYAQEYQNSYNAYLAQQAQYQAWLQQQAAAQAAAQQEMIDPRFQGNNMQQAKQDLMAARAEQQRLQMQQMAQNGVDPRQNAAFNTQQGKVNYVSALAAARQQAVENELRNNDIDPRFAQNSVMQQTKPQASAIAASRRDETVRAQYEQNLNEWREKIQRAEGITKPKTRNEYDKWHEAQVARQQMIDYERRVAALKYPAISNLITLSDSEFAMRYDAAEKAYKHALQDAKILRKDSSSSMDDLSSDANDIEAKATAEFVKWQNAARVRDDAMGAFYNESVNTNMKLVPHAPTWASEKDHDGKNYTAAVQNHWDATQYARSHDTDGSKYMPLVNEWSFINGRTALNYTQTHAVSNFVNNAASGGKKTQQYNAFVANCAAAFYNQPEGLTKNEREKMEAMLTLANLMTDEERARFNTILRQGGGKEADKYFEYLYASVLPQRFDSYVNNEMKFQTRDGIGKVFESVMSIPVNLAQGVSGVIHTLSTGQEDPIAAKLAATKYNLAQGARDAVGQGISSSITNALMNAGTAEDFAQWAGSAGNFLYGTGMSMADSATVAAISAGIGSVFQGAGLAAETASKIGSAIGGSLFGASAFNSSYQEALDNGLDPQKARITAIGNGLNEMIFETLSIGTLLEVTGKETIKVGKSAFMNWLVNTAVQAGVEGSEEVFTDIGNKIWDNRINGIFSEEMQKIREYVASGMTFAEAKAKVNREFAEQLGMSFLGGAISGGFMGGGAQFVNMIANRQLEAYGKTLSQERIDELKKYDYKSEQAQEILNSDKITNTDAAMLDIIHTQELVQESINYVEQAVAEGKMPQKIADIYKKFAEHNVQTETNPDGITDEEAEKMLPYVDVIKNAEAIKQGLGKIVEQQTAARKEFDALSPEQKQQRLQNITNETTSLRNAPSLRVGASESRLSGQSAAQEFTTRAKTDTITLNNDGSVKTANGSVTFDFGANKTVDAMTDNQARAIRFAAAVANKTGVNIKVEQEFVGADRNKNGEYNPETNTIRVNLSGTNSAIYTMSHELTHYLQSNNKQAFADLSKAIQKQLSRTDLVGSDLPTDYQDIIGDYLTGDNTLFEALCAYEKERYAKEKINLTQEKVEEEVIARCCESFLGNSSIIADMTQNHTKSARAVYRFLNEIRADINALRSDASERMAERGYASDFSPEQGMLEQFADIDKIVKLWENGLRKVAKKNKASGEKMASLSDTENEDIRYSLKENDTQYLDLARRYESGDKSVEAELRKAVQSAAKRAGYSIKAYHGTYRFGRTKFTSQYGALFLSSNPDVGQAFSGDQPVRAIAKQANPDTMDIDEAARWYKQNVHWGEFRVATDSDFKHEIERLQPLPESVRQKYHLSEEEVAWKDKALKKVESKYSRFLNGEKFYYFEYNGINNDYANSPFADVNDFRNVVRERLVKNDNGGGVYELYISPKNMITVDANGAYYASIPLPSELRKYATAEEKRIGKVSSDQLVRIAYEAGYDTLEIKNVVEGGDYGRTAKATDYVVMNPESQAKSADLITKDDNGNIIPLSERFKTENEDIRYSIRGRVALYSKPGSLDVRDLRDKQGKANLNIAYKMDREGIDSEKIRLATGWFKGYDGKWRSEIDDSEAKLADWLVLGKTINYMEEKARKAEGDLWDRISSLEDRLKKSNKVNGSDSEQSKSLRKELRQTKKQREEVRDFSNRISTNRLNLSDILDHAKLYENYPQLKDVSVHLSYSDRTGGYLGSATGTTDITIVTDRNSKEEILQTLMHEVQHIIQGIEGFAKGANVEYWADRNKRESADVKEAKATLAQVERELARVKYDGNPQASPLKSAESYAYITDLLRTDKPGTANYAYDTEQKEKYEKRAEEGGYADLLQKYLFAYQDVKVAEMEAKDYTKAFADYQRTAGEVEARDVASRLHMSEDERKATRPDIDRSDVTFFETDSGYNGRSQNAKYSIKESDTEYLDLARRYESGDKSVESELRKAVDAAAKAAGYSIKAFHGTTENFNVFSRKQQGANHKGYLEFGAGFYFTPSETEAEQWVKRGRSGQDGKAPIVMSVYLNPMRMLSADESVPGGAKYLRTWLSQGEAEFIAARTYRFINYLIEDKGFSNVEAQETLKALGYDAIEATFKNGTEGQYVVFDPSQVKSADLITKDDNDNIIPLSERFKTENEDIRFSLKDNVERKVTPETTMTMQQAKRMLEMTFNANGFRGYKGYKTADEWLQSEGAAEVAWYAENTETVVDQYFNRFPELTDYEVTIEEVLEAYQKGTLVGKEKTAKETIDLKTGNGYKDSRFYAPKLGSVTEETIRTANLRVTSANRDKVYAARRDVLFAAHTEEGIAALGLTQKELNKKLQNWSRYSERARTLSMKLNQDVAEEYWWTGLQNSSILSTINVTDQDIRSLVKDIIGTSNEYQRNYIGRTMLALDTHIDWSELTFEFTRTSNAMEGARGYYDDNNRHIAVGSSGYLNTVAHEMGHALDYKWGRDLFTKMSVPITQQHASNESKIASEEGRKFYHHFAEFSQKVEDACDIRSSYTQRGTEAFARFVARFVEWTANTAGSQSNYEAQYYNDRFTTGLYLEFVQILQEKARLDSMARNETRASIMDKVRLSTADGTRTFTYGDVTAKMYGNDVTLDGGKVRQRVQMLETLAERYDHVTVDASSEAEARAFENAGAKRVADEFSTGNEYGTYEFKFVESQFKRDSQFDAKQKANFAKAVLKQVGSRRNFTDQQMDKYRAALERAMTYLWNSTYGKGDQMAAYDAVDRLFDRILNSYSMMTEADADMRDALMSQMRKLKTANGRTYYQLDVTETQMSEIRNAHGDLKTYTNLLSKALGARVVVKQVDGATMLENTFKDAKDSRIKNDTVEGNMPGELLRLAQKTMEKRTNPYESESNERTAKKESMWDAALDIIGGEKSTQQKIRDAVKEAREAERKAAKDKTAKAVDEARLAERMHEGALRAKDRRVMAERESDLKRRSVDREARLKQQFRETTARTNEERLKRDMRKVALKWNQRLVKLLANPTEASHVPVQLAREVSELTKTITEYIDSGTERGRINLEKVAKAYQQAFDDQATIRAAKEENIKYDPRGSVIDREMYDAQLVNMIDEMNEILADKSFKELSAREMMGLLNIIRGVAHTVYDANRMIGTTERKAIWQVGDTMVKELESAPKIKGGFARFFLEESLDLRRIAKVFSGSNENAEFVKLSDGLNRGAIEKERVAQVLSGMFDPLTQQYGEEIRKWYGKNAEWIDTGIRQNGRKVEITKGMRVSLAMHVLNAGNMRHIENGGVTIPNRELYAKGKLADAYANGTLVRLNADQINKIISQMTEAEKAYVEVAKEFFHQRTGYYVNKTSLQLLGYRKATVENYFPIHTDRNYTKSDFASVVRDGSIEGQGFLKERVMASNPVYLEDITSVVNRQIKGVSLYAGLAVPMRNFNAVMNASVYEDENGNWVPRTTVRKAMTQSMGDYGAKVVQGFLQDVSGMSAVDVTPGERLVAKLQTRYVKAVLLANLKVTLKQAASYPTAAAVIPWKYLNKALLKGGRNQRLISRADVDLINQYTPLYQMRREGMANEITSIMAERGLEQKMPWLLGWITKMDVATVGRLWSACEYMVADQQNLPVGSDAYYKAVAEVFNQTIQQTQPNFTPLQRNAALRSKNPVVRTLTLFGTQRMQNGGILIESAMELAHSKNMSKEAQAAAKAKFGRAVVSQLVQNVMLVAIGLVVDALRGRMKEWQDDDKDITLESVAKVMGDQFLGNIFGSFLGGSEVWDIVSTAFKRATNANTYDTEFTVPSLDAIETIIGFFNKDSVSFVQYMSGDHTADEKITRLKNFSFKLAKAAGYLTGFPFENIAKTIVKGWIPALQDIYDATQTGELIPWLHQSGKLDSKKIAANYKAWTKAGYSGRDFFYWEKQLNGVSGGRDGRIPILLDSDLTNEQKALMMQMFDTADGYADGTVFYNKKGEAIIDFTAPSEKQQALPKPNAEPSEAPNAEPTAEPTPKPTENPLTEARQEGVQAAVKLGVPEQTAFDAFLAYQNMGKNKDESDGYSRNDEFREWLFKNVDSPEQMAVLEYQVIGQASSVKGAITYRDSGVVYRDYTNESWFKLSEHNLAKDGTNKRYEAGKQLEKTGLKVDKTVAIYDGLKELTKKAEWIDYLKNQNLNDDQIRIFLWSRGWKY